MLKEIDFYILMWTEFLDTGYLGDILVKNTYISISLILCVYI